MSKLNDVLKISCEIVSSAIFLPRAAKAVFEAEKIVSPDRGYLSDLEEWAKTGGHLPIIWGSGWDCDVPYLLNWMVRRGDSDETMLTVVISLMGDYGVTLEDLARPEVKQTRLLWDRAINLANVARHKLASR